MILQTEAEWRTVFLITSAVYFMGAVLYGLMASGEKQDWADPQQPLIDSEKVKDQRRNE